MAAAGKPLAVDLDEDRYHRQSLIIWWDQARLSDASVLVIGAGALGNELVKNLALVGVGTVVVVDMDQVENSNLSRGVLFREGDEGADKATVVAARAAELNPAIRVIPVVGDARLITSPGLIARFDVVLGGLDNREARLHVNQACWKAGHALGRRGDRGPDGDVARLRPPRLGLLRVHYERRGPPTPGRP